MVFAVLHFGELILLHSVLRAHGIPVAGLTVTGDRTNGHDQRQRRGGLDQPRLRAKALPAR